MPPTSSAALPTPVAVNTPYFPIPDELDFPVGKAALRMWPGTVVREMNVYSQVAFVSEYMHGQVDMAPDGGGTGGTG